MRFKASWFRCFWTHSWIHSGIHYGIQLFGLLSREARRFCKVPLQTVLTPIVSAALYLLIFGVNLGKSISLTTQESYLAFLIPGLTSMALIRNAFDNSSSSILSQKYGNELQDLRVAPLTKGQICFGKIGASLLRGLFVGLLTLAIGEGFYFFDQGAFLGIAAPGALVFFLVCGGLCFGSLGLALGIFAKNFEHIGAMSSLILLPLIYLGGVFFDLGSLHPIWQIVSRFNPLFYLINGVRYGVLGISDLKVSRAVGVSFLFFILSIILALMSLKKGSRYLR